MAKDLWPLWLRLLSNFGQKSSQKWLNGRVKMAPSPLFARLWLKLSDAQRWATLGCRNEEYFWGSMEQNRNREEEDRVLAEKYSLNESLKEADSGIAVPNGTLAFVPHM